MSLYSVTRYGICRVKKKICEIMIPSLEKLSIDCATATSERPRRGRSEPTTLPLPVASLSVVELDNQGRVVYVDLTSRTTDGSLDALRERLRSYPPSPRLLQRLTPINRGRILVEIEDVATIQLFASWLRSCLEVNEALRRLLQPLGSHLRLLGAQWIVPRATEYEPQDPHTDVDTKGEVISFAVHVYGASLGTLIDPSACVDARGSVTGGSGFGRANTGAFAYDTGAVHAGPGVAHITGPFPRFFAERVFFLVCASTPHRRDNGLRGRADLVMEL